MERIANRIWAVLTNELWCSRKISGLQWTSTIAETELKKELKSVSLSLASFFKKKARYSSNGVARFLIRPNLVD
jgi:hypothetical protein